MGIRKGVVEIENEGDWGGLEGGTEALVGLCGMTVGLVQYRGTCVRFLVFIFKVMGKRDE